MGLFLQNFTVLDFAHLHQQDGLQGESFYVSVELDGSLDHQGFILDFGVAKKILKTLVDETLDHKLLVPALHPDLKGTERGLEFQGILYEAPAEALTLLDATEITPSLLENFLSIEALKVLPENITKARFFLRGDERGGARFRYTHGLRLHQGNCQRLFHGHRNPIEVWQEGQRLPHWEEQLARAWDGAHFAYGPTVQNNVVEYESPQGFFHGKLPAGKVIVLPVEPSIENIAEYGAKYLRQEGLKGPFTVVAYEGLNKGASFSLP